MTSARVQLPLHALFAANAVSMIVVVVLYLAAILSMMLIPVLGQMEREKSPSAISEPVA